MLENIGVGDIVIWLIVLIGVPYGIIAFGPGAFREVKGMLTSSGMKKAILIFSAYLVIALLLDILANLADYNLGREEVWIFAIPFTILAIFLYNKALKRT
ncbi:MAG: hypothetical protein KBB16_02935 [Candidatus Pacebacteria bacterium]|nr:hypothetical protein [Candidatus Paceibacterota bacterium]